MTQLVSVYRGVSNPVHACNTDGRFYTTDIEYAHLYGSYIIHSYIDMDSMDTIYGDVYDMHDFIDGVTYECEASPIPLDIVVMQCSDVLELYMYSDQALAHVNTHAYDCIRMY